MSLPIVSKKGNRFIINSKALPESCNKLDFINSLYEYILDKYAFSKGRYSLNDINEDLTHLLKREGKI